jgi:ATP-dependent protease ClpP protease subunit
MAIKAERKGDSADIEMFGVVGDGWADDAITARAVKRKLKEIGDVAVLNATISSIGGYVDEGLEIYQMFEDHPAHVVMTVGAQAISCGSLIAIAGDERIFHASSLWLNHNPWSIAMGDYQTFEKKAADLKVMANVFADAYAARSTKTKEEIVALMNEDRFMDADEALAWGFCTKIKEGKKKPAPAASMAAARAAFESMKEDARGRLQRAAAMTLGTNAPEEALNDNATEASVLAAVRASARRKIALVGV